VPRPYSDDHPRAGLLKLRGLTTAFPELPRGSCTDPSSPIELFEHGKATAPLVTWLDWNLR
jgi:hypothetical protein